MKNKLRIVRKADPKAPSLQKRLRALWVLTTYSATSVRISNLFSLYLAKKNTTRTRVAIKVNGQNKRKRQMVFCSFFDVFSQNDIFELYPRLFILNTLLVSIRGMTTVSRIYSTLQTLRTTVPTRFFIHGSCYLKINVGELGEGVLIDVVRQRILSLNLDDRTDYFDQLSLVVQWLPFCKQQKKNALLRLLSEPSYR